MKQLIRNAKQIVILLLVISLVGCDEDTVILPQITSGFTYTIDEDTRTVTFINTSENANSYTWSFGDQAATTSTLNNPIFTYAIGVYTVVLTATNVAGASATFEDTIIFLDVEIPLITLIGDSTMNVTLGDLFTDPGATALDEVDGDLTANIVVGGDTVDTNVEGTYTITYDVSDTQGNAALQVERIVIVAAISCVAEAEGSLSASNLNLTFMSDPTASVINDGADFSWIDNPDFDNTENASCKVGQITKLGNNPWDNTQIDLDAKLDFNANTGLKIKVWSSVANSEVRIKLEETGNPGNNIEQFLTTSLTSGWEELTFPFTAADS
ncbi:MAG: PKD repeat protein, partial [Psychroserpens sp.]